MLKHLYIVVAVAVAVIMGQATMALPSKRGLEDVVTCDYVFVPQTPVDASTNNIVDFNFITGHFLAAGSGASIDLENPSDARNSDGTFDYHNELSAEAFTCEETATFMEGLVGQTEDGPSGVEYLVASVDCTCN